MVSPKQTTLSCPLTIAVTKGFKGKLLKNWHFHANACKLNHTILTGPGFKRNPDKECPVKGRSSFPPMGGLSTTERRLGKKMKHFEW